MATAPWILPDTDLGELYTGATTYGGLPLSAGQLVRVLQHAVRTSQPLVAHQAAVRLLASTHPDLLCENLVLLSVTDVGLANLEAMQLCIRTLGLYYRICHDEYQKKDILLSTGQTTKLWRRDLRNDARIRQAVALCIETLCFSPKSREAQHAAVVYFSGPKSPTPRFAWPKSSGSYPFGQEKTLLAAFSGGIGVRFDGKMLDKMFEPFFPLKPLQALKMGLLMLNAPQHPWKGLVLLACAAMLVTRAGNCYNVTVRFPIRKQMIEDTISKQMYANLYINSTSLPPFVVPAPVANAAEALEQAERMITPRFRSATDPYYQLAMDHCIKNAAT
jgi:hypothetical protein